MSKEITERYNPGTIPIPDTTWEVHTIKDNHFVYVGEVFVPGQLVGEEMDKHLSIKGYTSYNIAKKLAHKKYPNANPVIVIRKEEKIQKGGE